MSQLGLNVAQIGATLQNAYTGNTDAKYRVGNDEYDINVRLDAFDRKNSADVENITFVNNEGDQVALTQFASVKQSTGPSMLERKNRRTSVTLKSNVLGITSGTLAQSINDSIAEKPLPASVEMHCLYKPNRDMNDAVSDTTDADSSTTAGSTTISIPLSNFGPL